MAPPREFVEGVRRHHAEVLALGADVAGHGHWKVSLPPTPPIADDITNYFLQITGHFLLADGEFTRYELPFFNALGENADDLEAARRTLAFLRDKIPGLLTQCPAFLQAAIQCDFAQGTRYTADMVAHLEGTANLLVA